LSAIHTTKIDVGAVAGAMTRPLPERIDAWLDTDTGRVFYFARNIRQADDELDPSTSLWIEPVDLTTRYAWMRSFIETLEPREVREAFDLSCRDLNGLQTFMRLLVIHEKEHLWGRHLEHSLCQHALRWLKGSDIRPVYLVGAPPELMPLARLWEAPRPYHSEAATPASAQRSAAQLSAMSSLLKSNVVIEVSGRTLTLHNGPQDVA